MSGENGFNVALTNNDLLGCAAANIGDLNNDGINDLAIGAYGDDDNGSAAGALYILMMNDDETVAQTVKISGTTGILSGQIGATDYFGFSVCNLGDVDGDGITDLAVGGYGDDDGSTEEGAVWILFMNTDGTVKDFQKISSTQGGFIALDTRDYLGWAVAGLGDVDGDNIPDIAVSAAKDDDGGSDKGAVYIIKLNNDGTVKAYNKISDTQGNFTGHLDYTDIWGSCLANLGDVNGDGKLDLGVGAFYDDDGGSKKGALWVLHLDHKDDFSNAQKTVVKDITSYYGISSKTTWFEFVASGPSMVINACSATPNPSFEIQEAKLYRSYASVISYEQEISACIANEINVTPNQIYYLKVRTSEPDGIIELSTYNNTKGDNDVWWETVQECSDEYTPCTYIRNGGFEDYTDYTGEFVYDPFFREHVCNWNTLSYTPELRTKPFMDVGQTGKSCAFLQSFNQGGELTVESITQEVSMSSSKRYQLQFGFYADEYNIEWKDMYITIALYDEADLKTYLESNNKDKVECITTEFEENPQIRKTLIDVKVGHTEIWDSRALLLPYNDYTHLAIYPKPKGEGPYPWSTLNLFIDNVSLSTSSPSVSAGDDQIICSGETVTLEATGNVEDDYIWSNNMTGQTISFTPDVSNTYTVTVSDISGCTDSDDVTITVLDTPDPVISGRNKLCPGMSTTLHATGGDSFDWSTGQTGDDILVTPAQGTNYTVTATNEFGCTAIASFWVSVIEQDVDLGPDISICEGSSATLTSNIADGLYTGITWSDGQTGESVQVSPIFNTTYTVSVTTFGCTNTDEITVNVDPVPVVSITAEDDIMCLNDDGATEINSLTANVDDPTKYHYQWYIGDDIVSTDQTFNYQPTNIGNASVGIWITDKVTLCKSNAMTMVEVREPTIAAPTASKAGICQGSGSSVTLYPSGGTVHCWWNVTDPDNISAPYCSNWGWTVRPEATSVYKLTANDGGNLGCIDSKFISIEVYPNPEIFIDQFNGPCLYNSETGYEMCPGGIADLKTSLKYNIDGVDHQITDEAAQNFSYAWNSTLGMLSDNTQNIQVSPDVTSSYTVTVVDNYGCSGITSTEINVLPPLEVTITTPDDFNRCPSYTGPTELLVNVTGGTNSFGHNVYSWSHGIEGGEGEAQNISVAPTSTTTYTVTVNQNSYPGCITTDEVTVNILPDITLDAGDDITICQGETAILSATSDHELGYYKWLLHDVQFSSEQTIAVQPDATSTYAVAGGIDESYFCAKGYDRVVVNVLPASECGEKRMSTSLDENDFGTTINIYPNPANDLVWIEGDLPLKSGTIINLIDFTGKVVQQLVSDGSPRIMLSLEDYAKGIYMISINSSDGVLMKRVVKQ